MTGVLLRLQLLTNWEKTCVSTLSRFCSALGKLGLLMTGGQGRGGGRGDGKEGVGTAQLTINTQLNVCHCHTRC